MNLPSLSPLVARHCCEVGRDKSGLHTWPKYLAKARGRERKVEKVKPKGERVEEYLAATRYRAQGQPRRGGQGRKA